MCFWCMTMLSTVVNCSIKMVSRSSYRLENELLSNISVGWGIACLKHIFSRPTHTKKFQYKQILLSHKMLCYFFFTLLFQRGIKPWLVFGGSVFPSMVLSCGGRDDCGTWLTRICQISFVRPLQRFLLWRACAWSVCLWCEICEILFSCYIS